MQRELSPLCVKHYTDEPHPCIKGCGFDGLVVGNYREEAQTFVDFVNDLIEYKLEHHRSIQTGHGPAATIRNLLTPMLALADMVKSDAEKEFSEAAADQVNINVAKILVILDNI